MSLFVQTQLSTPSQLLIELAAFAGGCGWTIDLNVDVSNRRRLHLHSGSAHFELYAYNNDRIYCYACTGYDAAKAHNDQPGTTSPYRDFYIAGSSGQPAWFVSCGGALYVAVLYQGSEYRWIALIESFAKIGAWEGGQCLWVSENSSNNLGLFGRDALSAGTYNIPLLRLNNAWTAQAAPGLCGSVGYNDLAAGKTVNLYNGGLSPQPVVLFLTSPQDSSKLHPIGFAPGVYRCNCADLYAIGDTIEISGTTYLALPYVAPQLGVFDTWFFGDLLFALSVV
ncbi:MAG: hypothetical protein ACOX5Z_00225 [Desulfobulbus sp.]|jgi:hypothetical protein